MENVKNIGKIDIHAHAIAFKEYYPPYTPNDKNTVFADDKEVLELYRPKVSYRLCPAKPVNI